MKYFSTFSGIGGFELGIQAVDQTAEFVGYSEIDKYATRVVQFTYPTSNKTKTRLSLSYILEEQVDQKYFLSQQQTKKILESSGKMLRTQ